ncbi:MAG: hypothetical protein ACRDLQ_11600 [Solirubrobacterales bacterium]
MKRQHASRPVEKVKDVFSPPAAGRPQSTEISESFRRARAAIDDITTDLERLQRRAARVVKDTRRRVK